MPSLSPCELIVFVSNPDEDQSLDKLNIIIGVPDEHWPSVLEDPTILITIFEDALIAAIRANAKTGADLNEWIKTSANSMVQRTRGSRNSDFKVFPLSLLRGTGPQGVPS
jgi:hypothetical protein